MQIEEVIDKVTEICKANHVKELMLFGSYATGTATDTSDIDFAVKGAEDIELLREQVDVIPTLKKIDLFDYDNCLNSSLKGAMDRYGRKIY